MPNLFIFRPLLRIFMVLLIPISWQLQVKIGANVSNSEIYLNHKPQNFIALLLPITLTSSDDFINMVNVNFKHVHDTLTMAKNPHKKALKYAWMEGSSLKIVKISYSLVSWIFPLSKWSSSNFFRFKNHLLPLENH